MVSEKDVKKKIFSTFADVAGSLGYSPLHGEIIGTLLVANKPLSLQELAKETGYSSSMISLSLDLLEVLGVIKKIKKTADRKLYVQLHGDLLECLKRAIIIKVEKSIEDSLTGFTANRKELDSLSKEERENLEKSMAVLEIQIKRLDMYIKLLSKISLP